MLADVAMKTQDLKAGVIKSTREAIRDKNVQLKNEYMKEATAYGRGQPGELQEGYKTSAGILGGYPTGAGASPDVQMNAAYQTAQSAGQTVGSIGQEIGKLAELGKPKPAPAPTGWIPPTPSAENYIPSETRFVDIYKRQTGGQ